MPLEQRRAGMPAGLARLIMRLLQKRPADRPQSADEVLAALEAVGTPAEGTATVTVRHHPARRGRWLAAAAVVAAALVLSLAWFGARPRHLSTDPQVVAIAPFRVTGADSSLSYLREGMVDLLATKLGGTSSLRPADPRTVFAAWGRTGRRAGEREADAIRIAGEVGAGRLVQGEVVGSGQSLTVSARIIDVAGGATSAQATVEGPWTACRGWSTGSRPACWPSALGRRSSGSKRSPARRSRPAGVPRRRGAASARRVQGRQPDSGTRRRWIRRSRSPGSARCGRQNGTAKTRRLRGASGPTGIGCPAATWRCW